MKAFLSKNTEEHDEGLNLSGWDTETRLAMIEEWLLQQQNKREKTMLYMIMYDIENNKVRTHVAKYLIKKGCMRIQKSIYLAKSSRTTYEDIYETLRDINGMYQNYDSIFVLPIPEEKFKHMKVIGKNIEFEMVTKEKNVLFF